MSNSLVMKHQGCRGGGGAVPVPLLKEKPQKPSVPPNPTGAPLGGTELAMCPFYKGEPLVGVGGEAGIPVGGVGWEAGRQVRCAALWGVRVALPPRGTQPITCQSSSPETRGSEVNTATSSASHSGCCQEVSTARGLRGALLSVMKVKHLGHAVEFQTALSLSP